MTDWIWLNGELMPLSDARIGVEDRGFQFADGVYEVVRLYDGHPFTLREHLDRLDRSCAAIRLHLPLSRETLFAAIGKVVARCEVQDGMVYMQVTRGVAPRSHLFPPESTATVLCYARPLPPPPEPGAGAGAKLLSVPDERWQRCWIKSIALLPNVLAKNEAATAGADEAVFIDQGNVTECSASNLFMVAGSKLLTHPIGPKVLPGITRAVLLDCATGLGIDVVERAVPEEEAIRADEVFITSSTREVAWVGHWNGRPIGGGACGPITLQLHRALQSRIRREVADSIRT